MMINRQHITEASGNVDKLYGLFDKAKDAIEKASNAVLDVTDVLDDILVESTAIGGKIEDMIPSHIETIITQLTNISDKELNALIDGNGQSSINALKDLVGSIPYRDLKPETKEERIEKISMKPDLQQGPQSSIIGSEKQPQQANESAKDVNVLNMQALKESGLGIGTDIIPDANDFGILSDDGSYDPNSNLHFAEDDNIYANDDTFEEGETPIDGNGFNPDVGVSGTLSMDAINIPKNLGPSPVDSLGELDFSNVNTSFENLWNS